MYAYDVERPDHWLNIREAANVAWRGLTANVQGVKYLIIDKQADTFIMENEEGEILELDHFVWGNEFEKDKLVAASRLEGSPFKKGNFVNDLKVGNLYYDDILGWQISYGDDQILPLEELTREIESSSWFKNSSVRITTIDKNAALTGSFINNKTGEVVSFKEADYTSSDPSTGVNESWVVTGDDGNTYYIQNGDVTDANGQFVGEFDAHVDPDPDRSADSGDPYPWESDDMDREAARSDYDHWNEDADRMWWEEEGKHPYEPEDNDDDYDRYDEGYLCPECDSDDLDIDPKTGTTYCFNCKKDFPNEHLKSARVADFKQGPGGQGFTYAPGFILVTKWATPEYAALMLHDRCEGIVTGGGGLTSHAVVVARGRNIPCIVDVEGFEKIKPGDLITMEGESGIVDVNGGDSSVERGEGKMAAMGLTRFVWSEGNINTAPIPQDNPEGGKLHPDLMKELMMEGKLGTSVALGTIFDDGHADVFVQGDLPDEDDLTAYLNEQGATKVNHISDFSQLQAQPTEESNGKGLTLQGNIAVTGPKGSRPQGVAILPEVQSEGDIEKVIDNLSSHKDDANQYRDTLKKVREQNPDRSKWETDMYNGPINRGGSIKEARRLFSQKEQMELIEENMGGTARNINKLNLDGTHYVTPFKVEDDDDMWLF